jgi:hypothetical protein
MSLTLKVKLGSSFFPPAPFAEMDFSNDPPTEAGIELVGAFDDGLEQRLARRQGAGPVRPSLVIEPTHALVAQLDRASDFESEGREFESLRARHLYPMPAFLSGPGPRPTPTPAC